MDPTRVLVSARRRSTVSLRVLASRAGTSHSTLLDYENGRKAPSVETFARVISAAGFHLEGTLVTDPGSEEGERAVELQEALSLAELFPVRHSQKLNCPVFPRRVDGIPSRS